jgi:hypothetical protein
MPEAAAHDVPMRRDADGRAEQAQEVEVAEARKGVREDYGPTYYAAFLLDPDGNNVEAVHLR